MKKAFYLLLIGGCLLVSCNDKDAKEGDTKVKEMSTDNSKTDATSSKAERNKQVVTAMFDAFNKHDVNASFKDCAPDMMDYMDGSMPPMKLDSVKVFFDSWVKALPDYHAENMKVVADGDLVMVWADWSGTWSKDFMGQKATGKKLKVADVDIFKLNNEGKITEHHNIQPWTTIAQQTGMKM